MQYKDYYKIMGLTADSTQEKIKRAYHILAHKYHPDVSKERDAEAKFKELVEAYDVLKEPQKRAAYDRLAASRKASEDSSPPLTPDEGSKFRGRSFIGGAANAFSGFFGQVFERAGFRSADRGQRGFHAKGQDSHVKIHIDLEDSFQGATRNVSLSMPERDAQGHVQVKHKSLNIKIPKGIIAGQHIRLPSQGAPGSGGGTAGDLLLEVAFNSHPLYRVSGADIYLDLPVSPREAKLGAKIKVPTPEGNGVDLKIPAKSRQGSKLRLKGHGLPALTPGDFFVVLQIALPPANTEEAQEAYQEVQQEFDFNQHLSMGL